MKKLTFILSLFSIISASALFSMERSKNSSPVSYNGSQCTQGSDTLRLSLSDPFFEEDLEQNIHTPLLQQMQTSVTNELIRLTLQIMNDLYTQVETNAFSNNAKELSQKTMELH